ncbi:MAG: hypothetical protein MZV70_24240 [Desulfobacterales bacterium]|nr:hypothetical protein [Desulfobacterales bacterium]
MEDEKEREDSDYKNAIIVANREFIRSKKRRDDLTSQFHMASMDLDESAKGIKTIRATIENLDGQISRYEQDIKAQQESLKRWLQTEKQGEILVAVIYARFPGQCSFIGSKSGHSFRTTDCRSHGNVHSVFYQSDQQRHSG